MVDAQNRLGKLTRNLSKLGLELIGGFKPFDDVGKLGEPCIGLMVANCGPQMWAHFSASIEYEDGKVNPLDRWCKRILGNVAREIEAELVSPNDRPFQPFQQWARDAAGLERSPLGLLIHPRYGLWFGLRGALILPVNVEKQELYKLIQWKNETDSICEKCIAKPCLSACPVSAFSVDRLNVDACFSHIDSSKEPDCMALGCAARSACPVGGEYAYDAEQLRFHMGSFRGEV